MVFDIILQFIGQILILMSLGILYAVFTHKSFVHPLLRKLSMGIVMVFVVIYVMRFNIPLDSGGDYFFDVRSLAIGISGMFLGAIPTIMGVIAGVGFRIYEGGDGIVLGIIEIFIGASFGLIWRYKRLKKSGTQKISWVELYFVGLIMQIIILSLAFTLPWNITVKIFNIMAFPQLVLFPLGFFLTAQFMILQRNHYFSSIETHQSEIQFRNLFDKNQALLMLIDPETARIVDVNEQCIKAYGYTKDEFTELTIGELNTLGTTEVKKIIEEAKQTESSRYLFKHKKKNGTIIDVEVNTGPIIINNKEYLYSTIFDITEQKLSERLFKDADERLRKTILSVGEGVIVTDENHRIILVNDKAKELLAVNEPIVRNFIYDKFRIYSNKNSVDFKELYMSSILNNEVIRSDYSYNLLNQNNESIFVDFTLSPIKNDLNENHGAILVIRDVTIEKNRQEEVRFMSQHDYLTKLYNRYNFEQEFARLNVARQHPISLIIGDVNGLKLINDSFGHLEGDKLIKEASEIFRKAVRTEDIVCRWGGDEFAILLPQTDSEGAQTVIDRIDDLCAKSFYEPIKPSISIGLAVKEFVNQPIDQILNLAEEYMYNEKTTQSPKFKSQLVEKLIDRLTNDYENHQEHIEQLIVLIDIYAEYYDIADSYKQDLHLLAKYHDIGRVSREMIKHNESAYDVIDSKTHHKHPEIGSRIVATISELQQLSIPILHHHEKFDGSGFPSNIKGYKIHEYARLFSVIHKYELLLNKKDSPLLKEDIIKYLISEKDKEFDGKFVDKFVQSIKKD